MVCRAWWFTLTPLCFARGQEGTVLLQAVEKQGAAVSADGGISIVDDLGHLHRVPVVLHALALDDVHADNLAHGTPPTQPPPLKHTDQKHTDQAYCHNQGGAGGNNKYSVYVGADNLAACVAHVIKTEGCGSWFDYGSRDGWCNCVKETSGDCDIRHTTQGFGQHAVYTFQAQPPTHPPPLKHTDDAYCRNHGGIDDANNYLNKYSVNVGKFNLAACTAHVIQTEGCGSWFDYGTKDGWCDCVKEISGDCDIQPTDGGQQYAVYKLQAKPPTLPPPPKHTDKAYCHNRGGFGGNNKYSVNVGMDNLAACVAHVIKTEGCGTWFDYGSKDGWCDCVKATSGDCTIQAYDNTNGQYATTTASLLAP